MPGTHWMCWKQENIPNISKSLNKSSCWYKTNTEMHIYGTVLIVFFGMGKHQKISNMFNLRSYNYSEHLRWTFSILQCKCNILSVGNQSKGQHSCKIFHHWHDRRMRNCIQYSVLLYTFNSIPSFCCRYSLELIYSIQNVNTSSWM